MATAGRTRCETRAALQPLGRTRAGTRVTSNVLMTIAEAKFEIQEMTMAMGPGTAREKAMILEEEYEEAMAYAFTADPNPGESELCPPPIGVHIGEVESAPQTWADVRTPKYTEVWRNAMRAELTGHELNGRFSTDVVLKGVDVITVKSVLTWKTDSGGLITKAKAGLVARGFGQHHGVDFSIHLQQHHRYRPSKWRLQLPYREGGRYFILTWSRLL